MKVTVIPIVNGALETIPKGLLKGLGNRMTSGYYPNYSIVEVGQNTGKSPGDLGKFAATQVPVKNHQLTLM